MERRKEDLELAAKKLESSRKANKLWFDEQRRKRPASSAICAGDMVLVHQTKLDSQHTEKFANRWTGPYIVDKILDGGVYVIKELDGTVGALKVSGDRIKKFERRGY